MPTDGKIFAALTVPRRRLQGFTEKILPERAEGDNRTDIQRSTDADATTLIQLREKEYHANLVCLGMTREGRGVSPATPCCVPTKPHAVLCVPCLGDGSVSSELIAYWQHTGAQPQATSANSV